MLRLLRKMMLRQADNFQCLHFAIENDDFPAAKIAAAACEKQFKEVRTTIDAMHECESINDLKEYLGFKVKKP
jgi:hypothetical protein